MKKKLVEKWLFLVQPKGTTRFEEITIFGYECTTKAEATQAVWSAGKIINCITIYEKER